MKKCGVDILDNFPNIIESKKAFGERWWFPASNFGPNFRPRIFKFLKTMLRIFFVKPPSNGIFFNTKKSIYRDLYSF